MSFLTLPNGVPDFSKAVISLWFRVPKQSAIAASNSKLSAGVEFLMQGILPLITFGAPQQSKFYQQLRRNVFAGYHPVQGHTDPPPSAMSDRDYHEEGEPYDVDPSFIGLSCLSDGTFYLAFKLQMSSFMALSASTHITTSLEWWSGSDPAGHADEAAVRGSGYESHLPYVSKPTIADASYVNTPQPEVFFVVSDKWYEPDTWHHVLLSFDVGGTVSVGTPFASSDCRLWYAIDDVDYRGAENLQPYRDRDGQWGPDTSDPNAILTNYAWRHSGSDPNWEDIHYYENHYVGLPVGSSTPGPIPTADHHLGIPAATRYLEGVFHCEMAEFQMFTGVTLDTGSETARRAFIDFVRDEDGNIVTDTMQPVSPDVAEALLGKRPEVLLHGSSNWINGKNTGSLGVIIDSETGEKTEIPEGQFLPTGGILAYKPDPTLVKAPSPLSAAVRLTKALAK